MKKKGSRIEVMNGIAEMTGGGLKKKDLMYKDGKIISKKMNKIKIYKQRGGEYEVCKKLAYDVYNALHKDKQNLKLNENDSVVLEYITKKRTLEDPSNLPTGDHRPDFIKDLIEYNDRRSTNINSIKQNIRKQMLIRGRDRSNIKKIKNNFQYQTTTIIYKFLNYLKKVNSKFYEDYENIIFDSLLYAVHIIAALDGHVNNPLTLRNLAKHHKPKTKPETKPETHRNTNRSKSSKLEFNLTNDQKIAEARIRVKEITPKLPSGWKAYASQRRPGKITYINPINGQPYNKIQEGWNTREVSMEDLIRR